MTAERIVIASSLVDPSWPWGWCWLVGGCLIGAVTGVWAARLDRHEDDGRLLPGIVWLGAWLFAPFVAGCLAIAAIVWAFSAVARVGDRSLPERRRADQARIAELEAELAERLDG